MNGLMMFDLYFAGGEAPSLRRRVIESGARKLSISFWSLRPRLPKTKNYLISEKLPDDVQVVIDSGGFSANKSDKEFDPVEYLESYTDFVANNIDRVDFVTEFDYLGWPLEEIQGLRNDVWSQIPKNKFAPVWHPEHGLDQLNKLADEYVRIAVPHKALQDAGDRLNSLVRSGVHIHGLAITKPEILNRVEMNSVATTSWLTPSRYGETILWADGQLQRYPKTSKEWARQGYQQAIEESGADHALVCEDDGDELTHLAVYSFLQWEESVQQGRSGTVMAQEPSHTESEESAPECGTSEPAPDQLPAQGWNREKKTLPVMSVVPGESGDSEGNGSDQVLGVQGGTVRQCDSCYIRHLCPEYRPQGDCVFEIPVEIRTREQLTNFLQGLLEMQGQRVFFARYAEELEGGYPTTKLSDELDRLFELTERLKKVEDDRDFLRVSVEGQASGGVLSRLFGEKVGQQAQSYEQPLDSSQTNELLSQVVDANGSA